MKLPEPIERNGVRLFDRREVDVYMVRIEDKKDGHRWVLVVEAKEPVIAKNPNDEMVELRYFTPLDHEGGALKLAPQRGSALAKALEAWKNREGDQSESTLRYDEAPSSRRVSIQTPSGPKTAPEGEAIERFLTGGLEDPMVEVEPGPA